MSTDGNPANPASDNGNVPSPPAPPPAPPIAARKICPGCRTVNDASSQYCYRCGLKLGEPVSGEQAMVNPGGFWIRLGAFLIDQIILNVVTSIITAILFFAVFGSQADMWDWLYSYSYDLQMSSTELAQFFEFYGLTLLVTFIITAGYYTVAIGRWGRTIGKLATGLKVVRPDGSRVYYWRAFARYWGYQLNWLTLGIGFLVIAFNKDKRGLHDLVCDTMVIRK